jgi:glucose-6-phosphate isomerase
VISLDTSAISPFIADDELDSALRRAVEALETLLARTGAGSEMLGWLDLPKAPEIGISAIIDTAKRIQDENDCLVVVGIGGSYLGARAVIEALPAEAPFPVIFAGNSLSPEYHSRLFSFLEKRRFAVCVISKSGTTTEPAIGFRLLRERLLDRFGREESRKRIFAVTDPKEGALRKLAEQNRYATYAIPPDVGGRFSVLSPVGLLPCAAAGVPIREMLEGAASALGEFSQAHPGNTALRYAAVRAVLHGKGTTTEVLSTFHPELDLFCEWWKQLTGESEGKKGKGLFPSSAVFTTDLHSLGQYLQEGRRSLLETFLVASKPRRDIEIPPDSDNLDNLNYLAGRKLSEVNRKAFEGTLAAHAAGGLPVIAIEIPSIVPAAIGHLFLFFEIAVSVSARLLEINPFDQPGVEEYKRRMFEMLGKPGA